LESENLADRLKAHPPPPEQLDEVTWHVWLLLGGGSACAEWTAKVTLTISRKFASFDTVRDMTQYAKA